MSGALSNLQGGASSRGAAQNRMRALLNQDRALLSHRACGQADLEDDLESPEVPLKGTQTRGAAQNRMRELLSQDRAMLALREARRREDPTSEPLDDDFAAELLQMVDREWTPVPDVPNATDLVALSESRGTCLGATTSFAPEAAVSSVCTPGPVAASAITNATPTPVAPLANAAPVAFAPAANAAPAAVAPLANAVPAVASGPSESAPVAPVAVSKPFAFAAPAAKAPAPSSRAADSEDAGGDPIRTRGMAKLLALQGYRDRALSIYDELLAVEPDNAELRAEADRLRN
ncbi:MAG TPA: hypothetical protein VMF89_19815 [Polyangiales bacterium]|nr:hypothetical protein [Polyangiales bacterium]